MVMLIGVHEKYLILGVVFASVVNLAFLNFTELSLTSHEHVTKLLATSKFQSGNKLLTKLARSS